VSSYLYYPGCSMDGSGRAYGESLEVVCERLGIELTEIDDWNCCGAFEYFAISQERAYALVGRNLALAEQQRNGSSTIVAPCSACFLNLAKTDYTLRTDRALSGTVNEALAAGGLHYDPGSVQVRHLFEVIVREIGLQAVTEHVSHPLTGLRVAPYLGCLVTRPDYDHRWSLREHPLEFDRLLAALGAEVVDFPLRTACCGGHMTQISPETGLELIRCLVDAADRLSADMLVTVCPMCQMNVDLYQAEMNHRFGSSYHMPILFFTQLMGLAFGAEPKRVGIGSEIVSARYPLNRMRVRAFEEPTAPEEAPPARRPSRRSVALPMPRMPEDPDASGGEEARR
jgi:heterodisulfide reductase subunit B